jgi:Tfp pilus assembly protein PilF
MRSFLTLLLTLSIAIAYCQTDKINELVEEGIAYHDKGDYDNAIKKYKEALKLDPKSALVNYEIAFSYLKSKDYKQSFEYSNKVIKAGELYLEGAYILNGSALDLMNKQNEAIEVYQEGIKLFPENYLLRYNLGYTAYNSGKYELCSDALKVGLQINPFHGSSHNLMGQLMYTSSKVRSLLAFTYFLLINPNTSNSKSFFDLVVNMLEGGTNIETDKLLDIGVMYNDSTDHITYAAAELGIGLMQATTIIQDKKGKNDFDIFADNLEKFLTLMGELRDNQKLKGFWWDFYVDFFYELTKAGYGKTLAFYISQSAHNEKAKQWMVDHEQDVDKMLVWIDEYYKK